MRYWWRRRRRRRLLEEVFPADLAALFVVAVWLREWGEGLMRLSDRFDDDDGMRSHLFLVGHTLRYAADVIAEGGLEPGGDTYQRLMSERITET